MILDEIVSAKKKQLILDKENISEEKMKELAGLCERESISFYEALKKPGLSIIGEFKMFYELAYALGMDVLVEVHDETEMMRAVGLDAKIIGVNNRNLKDFTIDLNTTKRLKEMVPEGTVLVSESGVSGDEDVEFLKEAGVDALLIGTVFMEAEEPVELGRRWKK